ncbi:MAG: GNAT family N-acetyltransferase [Silicimonas sp.]|nr:GNAT family N-acetyltransferase [Silicimonas sp.]
MTTICPASPEDLPGIIAVQLESWRRTYGEVLPTEYLGGPLSRDLAATWTPDRLSTALVLIARHEGRVLGVAATFPDAEGGPYLDNLHVALAAEGTGVGQALMRATAKDLIKRGKGSLHLTVVETNRRAVRFYERLGGTFGAPIEDAMFGHKVQALPVHWSDLPALAGIGS